MKGALRSMGLGLGVVFWVFFEPEEMSSGEKEMGFELELELAVEVDMAFGVSSDSVCLCVSVCLYSPAAELLGSACCSACMISSTVQRQQRTRELGIGVETHTTGYTKITTRTVVVGQPESPVNPINFPTERLCRPAGHNR